MLVRHVLRIDQDLVKRSTPCNSRQCVVANAISDKGYGGVRVGSVGAYILQNETSYGITSYGIRISYDEETKALVRGFDEARGFPDCNLLLEYDTETLLGGITYLGIEVSQELLINETVKV